MVMSSIADHILEATPPDIVSRYESLAKIADETDFGELDRNVVVIDTETTGFSFHHDELIQIAAARMECGRIVDWYVTFVNPGKPIPEDIVHLTKICDDDVKDAPSPNEALAGLVEFAGDAIMVAHNVGFDKTFVTNHTKGYPLLNNVWVDSLDLSRIALPRLKSHRLLDLARTFEAPRSTHRADDDVYATCIVYRILLAAVTLMPLPLVKEIGSMVSQEIWSTGFVFKTIAAQRQALRDRGVESVGVLDSAGKPERVSRETEHGQKAMECERQQEELQQSAKELPFSVRAMRQQRILSLPTRRSRKDADDLIGQLVCPSADEIDQAFSQEGIIGSIYADYEARAEQREMAQGIRSAFESGENIVIEAGTGVGKSMAYLIPAILYAKANGVGIGVATKTNALLDQLVYKELPALAQAIEQGGSLASNSISKKFEDEITWAPLKGMSHYPCLRKVSRIVEAGPAMREVNGVPTT